MLITARQAVTQIAADDGPHLNINGIQGFGHKIIVIILLFIGLAVIASARRSKISDNLSTGANIGIGGAIIGGAAIVAFGSQIANMIFS